jgi:hypothetical protein
MPLDDLPDWLPAWCLDHLGGEPADVLFRLQQVSMVLGLRLADGTDVVVKARADDGQAVFRGVAGDPVPPLARSGGVGGARLGQPGLAAGGGAGGSGEWGVRQRRAAHTHKQPNASAGPMPSTSRR